MKSSNFLLPPHQLFVPFPASPGPDHVDFSGQTVSALSRFDHLQKSHLECLCECSLPVWKQNMAIKWHNSQTFTISTYLTSLAPPAFGRPENASLAMASLIRQASEITTVGNLPTYIPKTLPYFCLKCQNIPIRRSNPLAY